MNGQGDEMRASGSELRDRIAMTPLHAQPSPELGLDLVRDAVDIRRLPRWDPRYWGHIALEDEPRCSAKFRALGRLASPGRRPGPAQQRGPKR